MNYFQLSLRNIFRHRRRSLVTILTICLGFTALGVISGILNNIFSRLKAREIVVEKLGHLTFAKAGFFENGKMEPEKYLWNKTELQSLLTLLKTDEGVVLASPRLRLFGVVSNGKSSTIFITEATIPEDDQKLVRTPVDGRTENPGAIFLSKEAAHATQVAIGLELSQMLGVTKGETLTLLMNTKDGIANAVDVEIANVFNTGNPATDDKFILTNFSLAQQLYDTEGAERIVVVLKNPDDLNGVKERLLQKAAQAGFRLEAEGWNQQSKSYEKVKTMFGVIFRVLTIIITVIVLLTSLNTMQMAVTERTKEIGTMRAIGMLKKGIIRLFCTEGILIGVLGCLLALPFLLLISGILKAANITFVPPVASSEVPLVLLLELQQIASVFGLFCLASLVSSFLVSRKIAHQKVADSLMHMN